MLALLSTISGPSSLRAQGGLGKQVSEAPSASVPARVGGRSSFVERIRVTALCPRLIWQLRSFLSERGFVLESCDDHYVCEHSPIPEKSFERLSGQDPYAMILEIVLEFS